MFNILVDTCVWFDLAKDPKQLPVLGVVEEMIRRDLVRLIVPRVVVDEFRRNRARIVAESTRSLASHFRTVKEAIDKVGGNRRKVQSVISHLDDVSHKIPLVGGTAASTLDRIERILKLFPLIDATDTNKLRAAQRALEKRAPFHRDKNSMADALLIEIYGDFVKNQSGGRFAFVTHNKNDFSLTNGNQKLPHPDLAGFFSRIKSLYCINLVELLRRIEPSLVTDVMIEHSWTQDPRGLTEILEAEDLLFNQVWYNRHWNLRVAVEEGRVPLVDQEPEKPVHGDRRPILRSVWEGALRSAERVEREYGSDKLGPWDDFEWGMINGKLSALRWVLGDDWDMLDT